MLVLTGIAQGRRARPVRDLVRGPAILGFCLALAVAFLSAVSHRPDLARVTDTAPASEFAAIPARAS